MSINVFSSRANIYEHDLTTLLSGKANKMIAARLEMNEGDIQFFIDGMVTNDFAMHFDTFQSYMQDLRNRMGKQGAIGFLVGILIRNQFAIIPTHKHPALSKQISSIPLTASRS